MSENNTKTPGQFVKALLNERQWSQRILAVVIGLDETVVTKILTDKRPIDADMAIRLEALFGVSAETFLDLQKKYDLAVARIGSTPDPNVTRRAHLFGSLPVSEMIKRGWIRAKNVRDVAVVEGELKRFFGVASVDEIEILPHAAKKTNVFGNATPEQLAWLCRVRQMAIDLPAPKYSNASLRGALPNLKALMISADGARKVPRILMESGVRYVVVESLPSAKIDGVCFWLSDSPVIGMSLRHDRIDNFWFVLRHELEHVLQDHGRSAMMLDAELEGEKAGTGHAIPAEERIANEAAAEFCVPRARLANFIARKAPMFSERDIRGFAATLQIHPGIVAGQLQYELHRYELFRNHLAKIRSIVRPNAYSDGWGDVAPVEI